MKDSFTIPELSCEFPQISRTVLYEIITVSLGYYKFRARWGFKNVHGCAQNAEIGLGVDFGYFRMITTKMAMNLSITS
jgi:hypothetical protein